MYSGGILDAYAQALAAEEFARKVDQEREGHIRGEGSPYGVGGYQSEIPNAGTADVPVQFAEPGIEQPFIDPVDVLTGGVGGGTTAVSRQLASRAAQDLADPFGRLASKYGPQVFKKNPVPFEPKWNRQTELVPGYKKGAASIIDSDPYLRIEPDKKLMNFTAGKDTWVNNAFPYSQKAKRSGNPVFDDVAGQLYDAASNGKMSWEAADSLMEMMARGWR